MSKDRSYTLDVARLEALKRSSRASAASIERLHEKHFAKYLEKRSPDEPHDEGCQVTRLGPNYCCTCASNMTRRREAIWKAGLAGDHIVLDSLGSLEAYRWHEARSKADPTHLNPYRTRGAR